MEFTDDTADAMTWPSLAAAGRALDLSFVLGPRHVLMFLKVNAAGEIGRGRSWAVGVWVEGKSLGWLRRYVVRAGEARFE